MNYIPPYCYKADSSCYPILVLRRSYIHWGNRPLNLSTYISDIYIKYTFHIHKTRIKFSLYVNP